MVATSTAQGPLGVQLDRLVVKARNDKGGAITAGDLVQFGNTSGISVDPSDVNWFLGVVIAPVALYNSYGIFGIAQEDIASGETGEVLVRGYAQANVIEDNGGTPGAGAVGTKLSPAGGANLDVLSGPNDAGAGDKVVAIGLEAVADITVEEKVWVLFEGLHGFGVNQ